MLFDAGARGAFVAACGCTRRSEGAVAADAIAASRREESA